MIKSLPGLFLVTEDPGLKPPRSSITVERTVSPGYVKDPEKSRWDTSFRVTG